MPEYKAPVRDVKFVMQELLNCEQHYQKLGFEDASLDMIDAIIGEAAKFNEQVIAPINQIGDQQGCTWTDGKVTTPEGFKEAYQQYVEGGWPTLSQPVEFGGQGLPSSLNSAIGEFTSAANHSFAMYPGLSHGCMATLEAHGSEQQKQMFLPKLVEGTWTGTMCLTEAHCGTDLGMLRTKAELNDDGTYRINGSKIFISAGEHDLSDNIVHVVIARIPGSPEGTRGISLFLVPKFNINDDGSLSDENGVTCGSIEHKMGINGSATCVINFDNAKGHLIGDINRGLNCMFTFMNAARLGVANEAEGGRALIAYLAQLVDIVQASEDDAEKAKADANLALLTPIAKAFLTELGLECASHGVQVYGGHGFVKEWGMEQLMRDAKISCLYEGTTGIQALDLLGRKILGSKGELLKGFATEIGTFCHTNGQDPQLTNYCITLGKYAEKLAGFTQEIGAKAMKNPDEVGAASVDYLMYAGYVTLAYFWARMAKVAAQKLAEGTDEVEFYNAKIKTANFYFDRILPRAQGHSACMKNGADSMMALEADHFIF